MQVVNRFSGNDSKHITAAVNVKPRKGGGGGVHTQGDLTFLPILRSNALLMGKTLMSNTPSLVLNFV